MLAILISAPRDRAVLAGLDGGSGGGGGGAAGTAWSLATGVFEREEETVDARVILSGAGVLCCCCCDLLPLLLLWLWLCRGFGGFIKRSVKDAGWARAKFSSQESW